MVSRFRMQGCRACSLQVPEAHQCGSNSEPQPQLQVTSMQKLSSKKAGGINRAGGGVGWQHGRAEKPQPRDRTDQELCVPGARIDCHVQLSRTISDSRLQPNCPGKHMTTDL